MEGWGLHNEWIHWRFSCHFLFTYGCVGVSGVCCEKYGVCAISFVNPKQDHLGEHSGGVQSSEPLENLAILFSITLLPTLNSPNG